MPSNSPPPPLRFHLTPQAADGRDLGALACRAARPSRPSPRLTRPPPRPQMMPEGLVLVGVPQTLSTSTAANPQPLCFAGKSRNRFTILSSRWSSLRCPAPLVPRVRQQFRPVSPSLSLVLADPGCRADQGEGLVALHRHRVAGRLQLVERGPLRLCARRLDAALPPRARAHPFPRACRMIERRSVCAQSFVATTG